MKFRWLRDPYLSVLFETPDLVAVDKPYGLDTHTNESKVGQAEYVKPGLIELMEKQLGYPLHIVHRLDRTTTGVIVFAKSPEAAERYRGYFRSRETKKTYRFVTLGSRPDEKSGHTSTSGARSCNAPIIRNGSELSASTDFARVSASGRFEVWDAFPHTGRNHQIRIHGSVVGLPLLGDEKYGGAKFPFLCLHNRRLEFPDGVMIESPPPVYFDDVSLLESPGVCAVMMEVDKRRRLLGGAFRANSQSLRLLHTEFAKFDLFGSQLVLHWARETWTERDRADWLHVATWLARPVRVRFSAGELRARGEEVLEASSTNSGPETATAPSDWLASEQAFLYEMRAKSGLGLFLDQRLQRSWVLENSRDLSVLNLFSYTGGFTLTAVHGGAAKIVSVDSNKGVLNWARKNLDLNAPLAPTDERPCVEPLFLCRDVFVYLGQAREKKLKFDLVICDAPSFSRGEKGVFKIETGLESLLRDALAVTARTLLLSLNSDSLFIDDIRRLIVKLAPKATIENLRPSLDFEALDETPNLKSFLIQI